MGYEKIKKDIEDLSAERFRLVAYAESCGRAPTPEEDALSAEMLGAIKGLKKGLPEEPLSQPGAHLGGGAGFETSPGIRKDGGAGLIPPNGRKDYKALFGNHGHTWTDKDINFFSAVFSGRAHPGLIKNSMSETVSSDGGFLVPTEQAARIHAVSLENELVMPRAYLQPMNSNTIKIPAMNIGDHSSSLFGGFTASYTQELSSISENSPKSRAMELTAKKLTGLIRFSSELNADIPGGMSQIESLCGNGLGWYRDKAFLKG